MTFWDQCNKITQKIKQGKKQGGKKNITRKNGKRCPLCRRKLRSEVLLLEGILGSQQPLWPCSSFPVALRMCILVWWPHFRDPTWPSAGNVCSCALWSIISERQLPSLYLCFPFWQGRDNGVFQKNSSTNQEGKTRVYFCICGVWEIGGQHTLRLGRKVAERLEMEIVQQVSWRK